MEKALYLKDNFSVKFIYDFIKEFFFFIESQTDSFIFSLLLEYIFLMIGFTCILAIIQQIFIELRINFLNRIYKRMIKNKKIKIIRVVSEFYYLIDRFLFLISPNVLTYGDSGYNNSLKRSEALSPIRFFNKTISFFKTLFGLSLVNILIWIIIISIHNPNILDQISDFLSWQKFWAFIKKIDYKTINAVTGFLALLISIFTLIMFRTNLLRSKAKRKIQDEKYEQVIKYQIIISTALSNCLHLAERNINYLESRIDFLTSCFCEKLSSSNYYFKNDEIKASENSRWALQPVSDIEQFTDFESFNEELEKIENCLETINNNVLTQIYFKVNKSSFYEMSNLHLTPFGKLMLDQFLIDRNFILTVAENTIDHYSHLLDFFDKVNMLKTGDLSDEQFIEEYNYYASNSIQDIISIKEKNLEKAVIEFKNRLTTIFEESIYYYILSQQYIRILDKNSKLNITDWFLGK
ncbi:hypothetical protein ABEY05_01055 [Bacillus subtilis]|uniref:hypothetical protein n=1 Tax=Bacillus TaxID=1386 RepID=UPI0030D027C7